MKILMYDDHRLFLESFKILVENSITTDGVFISNEIAEINKLLREENIDVFFADYLVPDVHILEQIEKWKRLNPELKIVVLSGIINPKTISNLFHNGADGFLSKSTNMEELITCLDHIKLGKKYISKDFQLEVMEAIINKENDTFTQREQEVIELIKQGKSIKEKAKTLNLSENTIIVHRRNIMQKAVFWFIILKVKVF